MAKSEKVNRYRSGTKNPQQEVHVYRGEDGQVKVHVVDYNAGKIVTLEKKEKGA